MEFHYRLNADHTQICVAAFDEDGPCGESWFALSGKAGQMYLELAKADPRFKELA
mgnify:CR=1 FL=1